MLRTKHAALALAFSLAACAEDEAPAPGSAVPEEVALDVMVDDDGLEIVAVYPLEEWRHLSMSATAHLRYELRDEAGAEIVSGRIPDPRQIRVEGAEPLSSPFGVASLRLPAVAGQLVLLEGAIELGQVAFDPTQVRAQGDDSLEDEAAESADGVGSSSAAILSPGDIRTTPRRIFGRRSRASAVDILIIPEGYTLRQLAQFNRDARAISRRFLSVVSSQRNHRAGFNIWVQDVQSRSTGIDDPARRRRADTAFDVTWGAETRRCTWFGTKAGEEAARRLGRAVRADITMVLVNSSEHGGCAMNGVFVMTHTPISHQVMAHEMGHALLGLADEYDYGTCDKSSDAPNVAFSTRRSGIEWQHRITRSTPIPTPETARFNRTVGAFEGASYCARGAYRPQNHCMMQDNTSPMCAVCLATYDRHMRGRARASRAGETPCDEQMDSDGICDTCREQDPDCQTGNACGDGQCLGDENAEGCPEDCGCAASECRDDIAPSGCYCDAECAESGDCCPDREEACRR